MMMKWADGEAMSRYDILSLIGRYCMSGERLLHYSQYLALTTDDSNAAGKSGKLSAITLPSNAVFWLPPQAPLYRGGGGVMASTSLGTRSVLFFQENHLSRAPRFLSKSSSLRAYRARPRRGGIQQNSVFLRVCELRELFSASLSSSCILLIEPVFPLSSCCLLFGRGLLCALHSAEFLPGSEAHPASSS